MHLCVEYNMKIKHRWFEASTLLILGQVAVLESEITLLALAPGSLPIKVYIYPLFVLVGDGLRFRMPLEPCEIFHVKAP